MKRLRFACTVLPVLFGLVLLACADTSPTPGTVTLTVSAVPQKTPEAKSVPVSATADPFTATLTPEATFVPLPTETPRPDGSTPTPAPARATPYPSPEQTLAPLPATVRLGTVTAPEVTLRAKPSYESSRRAVLKQGTEARVAEEDGDWCRIESGSVTGWLERSMLEIREVPLTETKHTVIRVGSLNIHSCHDRGKMHVIADTLTASGLDAIGLQEVSRYENADWLRTLAEEAGYPYYYFSKTANKKNGEYGIALMSRYPILYAQTFLLDAYPGDEPRVIQYVVLLTDSGVVHFLNTHISAREMYIKSVNLASMVYTVRTLGQETVFMTGDFNCGPPRLIEFWPEVHFANVTVNTYGDGSVPKILDNVLYTGRIRVVHTEYVPLSGVTDHSLVAAELIYE